MYLKLIIIIVGFFIFNSSIFGQTQKTNYIATNLELSTGIVFADFVSEQPLPLSLCWGTCHSVTQTTRPSITFGGQVNFVLNARHQVGFSYYWQQIRIVEEIVSRLGQKPYTDKINVNFHDFYIQHRFQTDIAHKNRWWTNAIGADMTLYRKNFKKWPLFYRTSFSIPLKIADIRGISIEPFFQIGITNYANRIGSTDQFIRPFMVGTLVKYALEASQK